MRKTIYFYLLIKLSSSDVLLLSISMPGGHNMALIGVLGEPNKQIYGIYKKYGKCVNGK